VTRYFSLAMGMAQNFSIWRALELKQGEVAAGVLATTCNIVGVFDRQPAGGGLPLILSFIPSVSGQTSCMGLPWEEVYRHLRW